MARLIPPVPPSDLRSPGEALLFSKFLKEPKATDWVVLHSLDLPDHVRRVAGEADFVVIVPHRGVVILEVKGVDSLRREAGLWYLGRNAAPEVRGPFRQASEAMHTIRARLIKQAPGLSNVLFWSAVALPFVDFDVRSPEWHEWQVIDRGDIERDGVSGCVERVLKSGLEHVAVKNRPLSAAVTGRPTAAEVDLITEHLRGDFEIFESPRRRLERLEGEVLRYTREQFMALDSMEQNPRVLFDGHAGTGKTVLAVEAARRVALKGARTLLLCFNRALADRLGTEVAGVGNLQVSTMHALLLDLARVEVREAPDFWETELPGRALERLLETGPLADLLIIDEAQDLAVDAYLDCVDLLVEGGISGGRWRMFGDLTGQRLYLPDADVEAMLISRGSAHTRFRLTVNCRNTPRIATIAGLVGNVPECYQYARRPDDGVEPEILVYVTDAEQTQLLTHTLEKLYAEGWRGPSISILSMTAHAAAASRLDRPWRDRLGPIHPAFPGSIRSGTVHAFKGLEAPVIILTDVVSLADMRERNLVYVGCSRALQRLIVIGSRNAFRALPEILAGGKH